jgi:hypothetical protein
MWKRVGSGVLLATVVACGGDSSGPDEPPYPAAAGAYQVDGGFDGLTRQQASFSGTLTLTQASREVGTLAGTATMTGQLGGQVYDLSGGTVQNASVTTAGAISVTVLSPTGTATWTFTGNLSGSTITGRHTLASGSASSSGDWTGNRASAVIAGMVRGVTGSSDWEVLAKEAKRTP